MHKGDTLLVHSTSLPLSGWLLVWQWAPGEGKAKKKKIYQGLWFPVSWKITTTPTSKFRLMWYRVNSQVSSAASAATEADD